MRIPIDKIIVPELGVYTYETLQKELSKKCKDLMTLCRVDEFDSLTEGQLKVFIAQWTAMSKAVKEYKQSIE